MPSVAFSPSISPKSNVTKKHPGLYRPYKPGVFFYNQGQLSTPSAQRQPPQAGWVLPMQSSMFSAKSSQ